MKISLLTVGSHGDVRPYVALGQLLQDKGYEVRVATHQEFESFIRGAGLGFHAVSGNPREILEGELGQALHRAGGNVLKYLKQFREAAQASLKPGFDDCLAASEGADAIVSPFFVSPVAYQIARKLGCKTILGYLQPMTPTGAFPVLMLPKLYLGGFLNKLSHHASRQLFWQLFRDIVAEWSRESLQLKPPPFWGPLGRMERQSLVLFAYSRHLLPRPYDWPSRYQITGFWQLPSPNFRPSDELLAFLEAGAPPVYVGFGSMSNEDPAATLELVLKALQVSGQRAVLSRGWRGLQGDALPESAFLLDNIPHDWLFPRMRAVVHHAGAGTLAAGLMAGRPTVTVPFLGDQAFWAQWVFARGLGPRPIPRPKLTQENLTQALQLACEPQGAMARRATEMAARMQKEGGVAEAAHRIDRFLKQK